MGKFIVIQKEKVERSEHSELIKTAISLLIKHGVATELSTDQSIEERAIKRFPMPVNIHKDSGFAEPWRKLQFGYIKGATEQSLIEQMKAKEFSGWCSINGWVFYTKDNIWRKHVNGGFEYKTTEELFNQFANQK